MQNETKNRDFLLEIGTEEMPARFLDPALEQLKELAEQMLTEYRLAYKHLTTYGTPRRLVLFVQELADIQEPLIKEVKGPAAKVAFDNNQKPTRAASGFARSQGVDVHELIVKPVGPVDYVFAIKKEKGYPTEDILPELCLRLLNHLHFPKSMRWGKLEVRFARPIRWLLALFSDSVIPFSFAGITSGRHTYGHRLFNKNPLVISNPGDYFINMQKSYVLVNPEERRREIWRQITELAASENVKVQRDDQLLNEVANLVEYPVAITGSFDKKYLDLPSEVLVTVMREHQRYFPVLEHDGSLQARFISVCNIIKENQLIREGNERVLRARLADARFFWEEDLKTPLSARVNSLKKIVWQENLGTLYDKVERTITLAQYLAQVLGTDEKTTRATLRAAHLAKADLTSSMVYELPELQGIMGREYALRQGEEDEVARAIYEHYLPRFSGDTLPETMPGRILSLADRMDTLVGCFGVGIEPTGSQDPYALRRHVLGICYIILDGGLILSLREIIKHAYRAYLDKIRLELSLEEVTQRLEEFFSGRLRNIFSERGLPYDITEAVLSAGFDDLYGSWQRARDLADIREAPIFNALFVTFTRANNLSRKHYSMEVDSSLVAHPVEKNLYHSLLKVQASVQEYLASRNYRKALEEIALLKEPVDTFFDSVMVMVEDEIIRNNRLGLLKNIVDMVMKVADLSKINYI